MIAVERLMRGGVMLKAWPIVEATLKIETGSDAFDEFYRSWVEFKTMTRAFDSKPDHLCVIVSDIEQVSNGYLVTLTRI